MQENRDFIFISLYIYANKINYKMKKSNRHLVDDDDDFTLFRFCQIN
jgi:hypothetical protein